LLRGRERKKDVLPILNQLPKGLAGLDDAYDKAIKQIDEQVEIYRMLSRRVISFITLARRSLTVDELCHAVSTDEGDTSLDTNDVYKVETLISICAGVVIVDEDRGIVRLIHYTTQNHFQQILTKWHPKALEEMAITCLTYLSFDVFQNGSCPDDATFEKRLADHAFLDYAAHYWSEHVQPAENAVLVQQAVSGLALEFLRCEPLVLTTIQAALAGGYRFKGYSLKGYSQWFPSQTRGLHLVARYGLTSLAEMLVRGLGVI
jgi:hypothetical protein